MRINHDKREKFPWEHMWSALGKQNLSWRSLFRNFDLPHSTRTDDFPRFKLEIRESKLFDHIFIWTSEFFTSSQKCEKEQILCTRRKLKNWLKVNSHWIAEVVIFSIYTVVKTFIFLATECSLSVTHSILTPLALRIMRLVRKIAPALFFSRKTVRHTTLRHQPQCLRCEWN